MSEGRSIFYCGRCLNTFSDNVEACPNLACTQPRPKEGWARTYAAGDVIDRNYEVIERLAFGGAGVTYLVRALDDAGLMSGPKMALKLLFPSRDHGAYLRRLSTEAQILQELHHPNIVQYLGFVHRTGHSPYLLTHFEEGGNLLDQMRRQGKFSIRHAVEVGRQVCWALEKGHAQGIIHRDLKPENLLLSELPLPGESPVIRVADFGIAKVSGSLNASLTRAGAFVGTPQYAAPEQFLGEPASDKADVYSLGAVMLFLMTARPLVKDANVLASEDVYTHLMDALPPVVDKQDEDPDDLNRINQILSRAMALSPNDRCGVTELDEMMAVFLAEKDHSFGGVRSTQSSLEAAGTTGSAAEVPQENVTVATTYLSEPDPPDMVPPPPTDFGAKNTAGLRWFIFTTLAIVVMGFVGWSAFLSWSDQSMDRPDHVLVAEVTEAKVNALVESEETLPAQAVTSEPLNQADAPAQAVTEEEPAVSSPPEPPPPDIVDAVRKPHLGVDARTAALRAFKRNAQVIRRVCPAAVGDRIGIETLVSRSGRISWAVPLNRARPEHKCVADNMRRVNSGSRLKKATKVRLYVEP